jgi:HAD superfamily hydrolase (TIGR01490 family)
MMPLAIFDLDETLIDCDSATLWLHHLVAHGHASADMLEAEKSMMADYRRGHLSMQSYMDFTLQPLAGKPIALIDQWADAFVEELFPAHAYPDGLHAVEQHRAQGHQLMIISATADFIVRRIAARFGVWDVMAIELAERDAIYTGQTQGILSFREGKVFRLQAWLKSHDVSLAGSYGYSDSVNDLPLLRAVAHASVVNANSELTELARQNQWQQLHWSPQRKHT